MKKALAFCVLATLAVPLPGSGPYSPVRVNFARDDRYERGRSLFAGEVKMGDGTYCAACHSKNIPLDRKKLQSVQPDLQRKVEDCIHNPDRVNGTAKQSDMEALAYYLAKRYRL